MKTLRNHALQEALILLILCGLLVWYSLDGQAHAYNKKWGESAYLFPVIIGGLLGILGLFRLGSGLAKKQEQASAKVPGGAVRVLCLLGISLVYYAALSLIRLPYMAVSLGDVTLRFSTFEAATLLFIAALMGYLGVRKPLLLTLVPLCATLFLSVLFRSMLHVILP